MDMFFGYPHISCILQFILYIVANLKLYYYEKRIIRSICIMHNGSFSKSVNEIFLRIVLPPS